MGVTLEVSKMFAYIMIPISFFHYYSHQDPDYFRKLKQEHASNIYGNCMKKTEKYVKERLESEYSSPTYNQNEAFWQYGAGEKFREDMEAKANKK